MQHMGVDISSNNTFDRSPQGWKNLYNFLKAQGGGAEPFLIVKTTEATWYINPDSAVDVANARVAGFKAIAAYLFDHGSENVQAEENYFLAHSMGLPQVNDFEDPNGLSMAQYAAHAQALIGLCSSALNYMNQSEYQEGIPHPNLWLAQYDGDPTTSRWPCIMKQFSSTWNIPGVGNGFDGDAWLGTEAQFEQYFNLGVPTTIPPEPGMLNNCISLVLDPKGRGYWLVQADGGVFSHAAAGQTLPFYGSLGGKTLNAPIVDAAPTPDGGGYWLVGSDGGVFTFGDAAFYGSTGNVKLVEPIIRITPTTSGRGYYLTAKDGGIFTFGDAVFDGSGA